MITEIYEAIARCKEKAKINREIGEMLFDEGSMHSVGCMECAKDHEQLAAWLEELKERREADRWIPVSERLPDKKDYYYVWISDGDGEERPCSNWFDGERFVIEGIFDYTVLAWKKMFQEPYKKEDK